ncbi:MAG: hypothetical protein ABW221_19060 [Vicinamibacteria bacterium]
MPVVSQANQVIGGLFLGHPEPVVFTARAERLVESIAAQAAVAFDKAQLYGQRAQLVLDLRKERVDLGEIVRNAVETSRPFIDAGRHRLGLDLPGEPLWLEGDAVRLAQILSNLLNNAAKYPGPRRAHRARGAPRRRGSDRLGPRRRPRHRAGFGRHLVKPADIAVLRKLLPSL